MAQNDYKELFVDGVYLDERRDVQVFAMDSQGLPGWIAYAAFDTKTGDNITSDHVESVLVMMAQLHLFAKEIRGESA